MDFLPRSITILFCKFLGSMSFLQGMKKTKWLVTENTIFERAFICVILSFEFTVQELQCFDGWNTPEVATMLTARWERALTKQWRDDQPDGTRWSNGRLHTTVKITLNTIQLKQNGRWCEDRPDAVAATGSACQTDPLFLALIVGCRLCSKKT